MNHEEDDHQKVVCQALGTFGVAYYAVPNGGRRGKVEAARMKGLGVKSGVPDLIIIDAPPRHPGKVGMAIELKRIKGGKTSDNQKKWIQAFQDRNWIGVVCNGATAALDALGEAGYFNKNWRLPSLDNPGF